MVRQPEGAAVRGQKDPFLTDVPQLHRHHAILTEHAGAHPQVVGADGGDQDVLGGRFHNGPAGGDVVGSGTGGGADDDPIAAAREQLHPVGVDDKVDLLAHGAGADGGLVEGGVLVDDPAVPDDPEVQHHVGLQPVFALHHLAQQFHLARLQLGHVAQAAGVHPQDGDVVGAGEASQVEDGAVAAEADEHIGAGGLFV